jgi:hypothetical protein
VGGHRGAASPGPGLGVVVKEWAAEWVVVKERAGWPK